MAVIEPIARLQAEMTRWRRDIHAHPELGFEENRTSDIVAEKLSGFGLEVHRGIGKTGVVGVLRAGTARRSIGLRADMDALPIQEENGFAHRSTNDGRMHACGHDGHTTMLLGAAKYLAESRSFYGVVNFIFQPAEDGIGGARAMIADGLFEKFPCEAVFGMHNRPGLPLGKFAVRAGPMMAGGAFFDIRVIGKGSHGARPESGVDSVLVTRMSKNAPPAIIGPARTANLPSGRPGRLCMPNTASQGNFSNRPSAIIARAPPMPSSAGWKMKFTTPSKLRVSARYFAAPSSIVVWPSCPQACMRPWWVER